MIILITGPDCEKNYSKNMQEILNNYLKTNIFILVNRIQNF